MSLTATHEVTEVRIFDAVRYCINISQSCSTRCECSKYIISTTMRVTSLLTKSVATLYFFEQTECNLYRKQEMTEQKLRENFIVLSVHDIQRYFYVTDTPYDAVLSTHDSQCFSKLLIGKSNDLTPTSVKLDELR